ncbi:thiamine biosynthesis protein ThiF [Vibrio thalassae]|uniref:Thiamine biosynthesis protein ThiF n=1 Tax=Vibrio thalassae TaxID=1243014 RepID=A0A240EJ09_9VIBR|nr:PRTRC system ThiF family protein [Vibrio thalassae]SNX47920.1 thiamine biosynthesis protein ThiF [Vibrio thalassae]
MYRIPLEKLGRELKVALVGVGGSGSAMALELMQLDRTLRALDSQTGFEVHVYDSGVVTQANVARQAFFDIQIGVNKAEAMVWQANNLHGKEWVAHPYNACLSELHELKPDIIITALDRPSTRFEISKMKPSKHTLWADMGNNATAGQVVLGELGNATYLPNVCALYDYSQLTDDDAEKKSCSAEESINRQELGTNQFAARICAQILWRLLRHGEIEVHGAYFDTETLTVDPIRVCEETWAMFGYTPSINNPRKSLTER